MTTRTRSVATLAAVFSFASACLAACNKQPLDLPAERAAAAGSNTSSKGAPALSAPRASTAPGKQPVTARLLPQRVDPKDPRRVRLSYGRRALSHHVTLRLEDDLTVKIRARGTPGSTLQIGRAKATLGAAPATLEVDLAPAIFAALSAYTHTGASYSSPYIPAKLDVRLTHPTRPAGKLELGVDAAQVAGAWLYSRLTEGKPALLAGESTTRARKKLFIKVYPKKGRLYYSAKGKLADSDIVVFSEYVKSRDRSCGSYRGRRSGRRTKVSITFVTRRIAVYERRSGRKLGQRLFTGHGGCPRRVRKSYKIYYPSSASMERYIKRFL